MVYSLSERMIDDSDWREGFYNFFSMLPDDRLCMCKTI